MINTNNGTYIRNHSLYAHLHMRSKDQDTLVSTCKTRRTKETHVAKKAQTWPGVMATTNNNVAALTAADLRAELELFAKETLALRAFKVLFSSMLTGVYVFLDFS